MSDDRSPGSAAEEPTPSQFGMPDPPESPPQSTSPSPGHATTPPSTDGPPRPAETAAELATRLVAAEDVVRDPGSPEDHVRRAAFETQVLYRQLARKPRWQRRVVQAAPKRYRATIRAHTSARRDFRSMHRTLSDRLPAWRIVEPASEEDLLASYRRGQADHGIRWEILAAINLVETGMGRIRGTSVAGARGPMQFIPETWARFGQGDIDDPDDAIQAAARHLSHHVRTRGSLDRALYAYNNHPAYVRGVRAYARVLEEDPAALRGLHHWQILYLSEIGDLWLPAGYERRRPLPVRRYVDRHPDRHLGTDTR